LSQWEVEQDGGRGVGPWGGIESTFIQEFFGFIFTPVTEAFLDKDRGFLLVGGIPQTFQTPTMQNSDFSDTE
jgi:hypothetical protein